MGLQIADEYVPFAEAIYADLGSAIRGVCQAWCDRNGYSDPFCRDGVWWAFPPNGVMPVRIETVMGEQSQRLVRIGPMRLILFPDGSIYSA
ncbi:hypothetical protein N836_03705 [Leptolyngbya sp. Heron Island J]|uniref:hypothetical protein n=1 Tax=Leptolyngbya sp. Heron Island J TaxID=1385935 RepID=UPI0003B97C70|nr:hypothetical protein [Leptolyngbya sp. Heron Island J]ESA37302.1 hypothetical protein N836_03705 [Leptolyngbya sp. Heron Island J]